MKILDIKKEKKNYIIYLENEEIISNEDTIIKYYLRKDMELDTQKINSIKEDSIFFENYSLALNYLSKSICSKEKMKTYLAKKGIETNLILKIIDKLVENNLVNDKYYFSELINHYINLGYGPYYIKEVGKQNKIDNDIIESSLSNIDNTLYENKAYTLIEKSFRNKDKTDKKEINKVKNNLYRRGFSLELINKEMEKYLNEDR